MEKTSDRKDHPLLGAVICCSAIDPDTRDEIHNIANLLGASKCTFDLTMDVTHLVVGNTTSQKYKFVAKHSPDVQIVLAEFFTAMRLKYVADEAIDLDALHKQYQAPVVYKLRISITGYTDMPARENLIKAIEENGAEYSADLDRTVTHLIAKSPSGRKYDGAAARGVVAVSEEWLYDSITRGMALDEALYDVRIPAEERGINAWNRKHVPRKFGKRGRDDDTYSVPQPSRKLRRTLSSKLANAQDAIWADLQSRPIEKQPVNLWHDSEQNPKVLSNTNIAQKDSTANPTKLGANPGPPKASTGVFTGVLAYLHGFTSSRKVRNSDATCYRNIECIIVNSTGRVYHFSWRINFILRGSYCSTWRI
jgi:DNA replication regulator DPB11